MLDRVDPFGTGDPHERLAFALQHGIGQDIIEAAYGAYPSGFLAGLLRIGPDAYSDPADYQMVFDLYADPDNKAKLRAARHLGRLTEDRLRVLDEIEPPLLHVKFVQRFTTGEEVRALNEALGAIRSACPEARGPALEQSARDLPEGTPLRAFLASWLRKCLLPEPPITSDPAFGMLGIRTATELIRRSAEHSVCSGDIPRVLDAVVGRTAYYAYTPMSGPQALIQLVPLTSGGWLIECIAGKGNSRLPQETRKAVLDWFAERGVGGVRRARLEPGWRTVLEIVEEGSGWIEFEESEDRLVA